MGPRRGPGLPRPRRSANRAVAAVDVVRGGRARARNGSRGAGRADSLSFMEFPRPLLPGDRIGVTAPSSGVQEPMRARFDVAVRSLADRGYDVVLGECLGAAHVVSAPKEQRAAELTAMLADPSIPA